MQSLAPPISPVRGFSLCCFFTNLLQPSYSSSVRVGFRVISKSIKKRERCLAARGLSCRTAVFMAPFRTFSCSSRTLGCGRGPLSGGTRDWSSAGPLRSPVSVESLRRVRLFATPWTIAHQAPLSMEFSRQEYWSRWPLIKQRKTTPMILMPPALPAPCLPGWSPFSCAPSSLSSQRL